MNYRHSIETIQLIFLFLVDNNDNVKMRKILTMLLCSVCLLTAKAQTIPNMYRNVDQAKMNHWVDSVFDKMSYDERIGQLFMVISEPKSDNRTMQRLMRYVNEIKLGGILFHKVPIREHRLFLYRQRHGDSLRTNGGRLPGYRYYYLHLRLQKASRVPMFVSLDGEWGLSMRLSGTTRFPKNMMLGAIEDDKLITEYGKEVARQCKEMGIQINFAPDIDVNSNTDNPVIGLRSFGENPPFMASASVKQRPLKPSSSCNSPVTIGREKEEGTNPTWSRSDSWIKRRLPPCQSVRLPEMNFRKCWDVTTVLPASASAVVQQLHKSNMFTDQPGSMR
mgnify:CR=1 FL=1